MHRMVLSAKPGFLRIATEMRPNDEKNLRNVKLLADGIDQ
jgi:hypothetical protein